MEHDLALQLLDSLQNGGPDDLGEVLEKEVLRSGWSDVTLEVLRALATVVGIEPLNLVFLGGPFDETLLRVDLADAQRSENVAQALALADPEVVALDDVLAGEIVPMMMENINDGIGPFTTMFVQYLSWKVAAVTIAGRLREEVGEHRFEELMTEAQSAVIKQASGADEPSQ